MQVIVIPRFSLHFWFIGSLSHCRFIFPKVIFVYMDLATVLVGKNVGNIFLANDILWSLRCSFIISTALQLQFC